MNPFFPSFIPPVCEPFGIVSLQAMAMEKRLFSALVELSASESKLSLLRFSYCQGFREQVISSGIHQNRIHINGEDSADIAWGIKETLKDVGRKWTEGGFEYFTWRKTAEQTLEVYNAVMREKQSFINMIF
ncbi:hypothetical protein KEJ37_04575 [Candidatus Bathyarchaeota archaeon]|nr:hypothetical protein [Candidatus Bathyarchaeota archaeon]